MEITKENMIIVRSALCLAKYDVMLKITACPDPVNFKEMDDLESRLAKIVELATAMDIAIASI